MVERALFRRGAIGYAQRIFLTRLNGVFEGSAPRAAPNIALAVAAKYCAVALLRDGTDGVIEHRLRVDQLFMARGNVENERFETTADVTRDFFRDFLVTAD